MIQNGYSSRNIPSFDLFKDVYHRRIEAKKSGDKVTANSLKLVLNTTYGATLNRYNDLYDPLQARSVCISGQLYLLELACHLLKDIKGLRVVELNTDGIMVEFDDSQYDAVNAIIQEWQDRTHFGLEEDVIARYYAKDVNNYVEVDGSGEVKKKGGYVVRGIAPVGAFNINNNATIVAKAITEYFVNGTPAEETINASTDVFEFQMIAKAGAKYKEAYHLVNGVKQPVQKVNRVYATADERYGKVYKVKADDDSEAKIDSLPEHCIIDNSAVNSPNHTRIDQIDKTFYINMARKRINDFLGIKPEKPKKVRKTKMAKATTAPKSDAEPMNILQKLQKASALFLAEGVKKSGMNADIEFMYFELSDIVPVATPIFEQVRILPLVYMDKELAYMDMVNLDDRNDKITFSIPLATWQGNRAINPIQVIGATVTYYRRYLYQIALDIVEQDEIDNKPEAVLTDTAPANKAPATPDERAEVKKELTNAEGQADSLQLTQLRKTCKTLKDKAKGTDKEKPVEEWLAQIALRTEGFVNITKTDCAKVLSKISEMMEEMSHE